MHPKNIYTKLNLNNSYDAFYTLMELGADPLIKNNYNTTPIDYCIKNSLINNLNILYYFRFQVEKEDILQMMETNNYYKLIKHTLWILDNYDRLDIDFSKSELEDILLSKIIHIQHKTTSYHSTNLLQELNHKIYFDDMYKLKMFDIDENKFFN